MKITYLYNSGFAVEIEDCLLLFDCYRNAAGAFPENGYLHEGDILNRPVYVFVSHGHPDHYNPAVLKWQQVNPSLKYILCRDLKKTISKNSATKFMDEGRCYSDNNLFVKAFGSTDEGVSFLTQINSVSFFHAGDLNLWHWKEECPPEESKTYYDAFYTEMQKLEEGRFTPIDVAFFPVDPRLGKDYYEGALYFVRKFQPKYLIPMHFGGDFQAANRPKEEIEALGTQFLPLTAYGQVITLPDE